VRSIGLWTAVAWLALTATLLPPARAALTGFAQIAALLLLGFLVSATRTVRWSTLGRMFTASLAWALMVGIVALTVLTDTHSAVAEALWTGLGRESLALLPLAAVTLAVPRRVRRFAVSDWLLLGLAGGLAFQSVQGLLDGVWAGISSDPAPGPGGLVFVSTAVVSGAIGLAVVGRRRARQDHGIRAVLLGGFALIAPVLVVWLTVSAPIEDAGLAADAAVPLPLRLGGQVSGLLPSAPLALLVATVLIALLVDARHLLATDEERSDLSVLPTPWLAAWWAQTWTERLSREPTARGTTDPDEGAPGSLGSPITASPATQPPTSGTPTPGSSPSDRGAETTPYPDLASPQRPSSSAAQTFSTAANPTPVTAAHPSTPDSPAPGSTPPGRGAETTPLTSSSSALTSPQPAPSFAAQAFSTAANPTPITASPSSPTAPGRGNPETGPRASSPPTTQDPAEKALNEDDDPDRERGRHRAAQSRTAGAKTAGLEGLAVVLWFAARIWRAAVLAASTLVAYVLRDKMVILASHAGVNGESRLTRLVRGRAAMEMTRHARREAYLARSGPAGRVAVLTWRITAAAILVLLLAGIWWTQSVRTGPTVNAGWLTQYRAGLHPWWSGLMGWEQGLLVGGAIALVALSTASLGPAFNVCGAATYLSSNGYGAATFVRSPRAAVRTYLGTATPGAVLADGAEALLTFVPVTFGGAMDSRAVRATTDDYLRAFDLGGVSGYLTRAEPFSEFITRAIPVPGYYDVSIQADRGYGGGGFSSRAVARLILKDPIYAGGPVRLIPGRAGGTNPSSAQALADRLGVAVLAPSDTVFAFDSGRLVVGPSPLVASGQWITFEPGGRR
jgi:hypothetical protein